MTAVPIRTRWTAAELQHVVFPDPRWAVPGLIAEGATLLVGPPKVGKSWAALNIAVAVASGGRALGRVPVEEGDVLYLALEDRPARLQSRLQVVLGYDPWPERLTVETYADTLSNGGVELIEAWLAQKPDARLVVVDVLVRLRDRTSERTNRYDSDYETMACVKDIAERAGVPLLCVHHTRKQTAEDFVDAVSGTHGLAGAADAVLVLARSRGSADAILRVTGRDIEEAEHALRFAPEIGTWTLLDGPAGDYALGDTRRRVLQLLRDEEGLGPKAIADRLGITLDNAKQTVTRMAKAGELDTDGAGHYFAPLSPVTPVTRHPAGSDNGDSLTHSDNSDRGDIHERARLGAAQAYDE